MTDKEHKAAIEKAIESLKEEVNEAKSVGLKVKFWNTHWAEIEIDSIQSTVTRVIE